MTHIPLDCSINGERGLLQSYIKYLQLKERLILLQATVDELAVVDGVQGFRKGAFELNTVSLTNCGGSSYREDCWDEMG